MRSRYPPRRQPGPLAWAESADDRVRSHRADRGVLVGALDKPTPPLVPAMLAADVLAGWQRAVTSTVGQRPMPGLWGSKTGHRLLACGFASGEGRMPGRIAGS